MVDVSVMPGTGELHESPVATLKTEVPGPLHWHLLVCGPVNHEHRAGDAACGMQKPVWPSEMMDEVHAGRGRRCRDVSVARLAGFLGDSRDEPRRDGATGRESSLEDLSCETFAVPGAVCRI